MKAYIKTYGCTLNQADSRLIENILTKNRIALSNNIVNSEAVIVNTCTVKKATEQKILNFIESLEKNYSNKKIIVTGCMASANKDLIKKYSSNSIIIPIKNIEQISEVASNKVNIINKISSATIVKQNKQDKLDRLIYFAPYKSIIAKIPVGEGCLSACNFCETRFARGPLNSFSEKLILDAIKKSIEFGAKEIQLTAQDIGCYGFDKKTNIIELLKKIKDINGDFKLRLGMMNPEYLNKFGDELIEILTGKKFYRFIHIPIQSGSNRIIKSMGRKYEIERVVEYIKKIRKEIKEVSIETDIIAGYPDETNSDFQETKDIIKIIKPDAINISKFAIRPHAKKWNKVINAEIVNERSRELSKIARQCMYESNKKYLNKTIEVLITEKTNISMNGRSNFYKQVIIKEINKKILGSYQKVNINFVTSTSLYGIAVN